MIRLATETRRAFATCKTGYPVGPFNFFVSEQKALGKMVMHHVEGEYGREMDTISYYEFRDVIRSPNRMPFSPAITQTIATLKDAQRTGDIQGRERLAQAQNHLVDLLAYIEEKEGYELFAGKRLKCGHGRKTKRRRAVRAVA